MIITDILGKDYGINIRIEDINNSQKYSFSSSILFCLLEEDIDIHPSSLGEELISSMNKVDEKYFGNEDTCLEYFKILYGYPDYYKNNLLEGIKRFIEHCKNCFKDDGECLYKGEDEQEFYVKNSRNLSIYTWKNGINLKINSFYFMSSPNVLKSYSDEKYSLENVISLIKKDDYNDDIINFVTKYFDFNMIICYEKTNEIKIYYSNDSSNDYIILNKDKNNIFNPIIGEDTKKFSCEDTIIIDIKNKFKNLNLTVLEILYINNINITPFKNRGCINTKKEYLSIIKIPLPQIRKRKINKKNVSLKLETKTTKNKSISSLFPTIKINYDDLPMCAKIKLNLN